MRYLPIVLLIGILFNSACVLVFRMKLDRRMNEKFETFSTSLQSQLSSLTSSALSSIDAYFVSNSSLRVSSSSSVFSSSFSSFEKPRDVFFRDLGSWDYDFFCVDGDNVAKVGISYFRVGDPFPKGGVITAIYPDVCVVDGEGFVSNSSFSLARSSSRSSDFRWDVPDTTYKPPKEFTDYVNSVNTMRK